MSIVIGILIPFLGTTLGAFFVFFMKNGINNKLEKILLGFASGVMIAASVWSLIIPSIDIAKEQGIISWFPSAFGFFLGVFSMILLDKKVPHINLNNKNISKGKDKLRKTFMLALSVTIHNVPEGMAVGVSFAGVLSGNNLVTLAGAFSLAVGIAIQNLPEGLIISAPLKNNGFSKSKAFLYGILSGIVEPVAAVLTLLLTKQISAILPYLLSFAAGVMIFVVATELIPESKDNKSYFPVIGLSCGFVIMMILDVALS